jgi:hypothetical protein
MSRRRLSLAAAELDASATDLQWSKLLVRSNALRRKIKGWCNIQQLYMPVVAAIRAREDAVSPEGANEVATQAIPLHLPSSLPVRSPCDSQLQEYEWRLRYAQANDALDALRHNLRLRAHVVNYKYQFARGQIANLRSNDVIARTHRKIEDCTDRYRTARRALVYLAHILKKTGWASILPVLLDTDVRQMTQGLQHEGEGKRTLSWIWRTHGVGGDTDDESVQDSEYPSSLSYYILTDT